MAEKDLYTVANMKKKWKYRIAFDGTVELIEYKGEESDVEIPPRIGKYRVSRLREPEPTESFFRNGAENVTFSDGLTIIDNNIFDLNTKVQSIPESVMVIGEDAFPSVLGKLDVLVENYELVDNYYYRKQGKREEDGLVIIDDVIYGFVGDKSEKPIEIPEGLEVSSVARNMPYLYYKAFERTKKEVEIDSLKEGDEFEFGYFPQDYLGNVKPIEWIVVFAENDSILALSKDILVPMPYQELSADAGIEEYRAACQWRDSTIRNWLNGTFYEFAFDESDKKHIKKSEHDGVEDSVIILGTEEIKKGFPSATVGMFGNPGTKNCNSYSLARDFYVRTEADSSWWWLMDQGINGGGSVMAVYPEGQVNRKGMDKTSDFGVCPAIWLSK